MKKTKIQANRSILYALQAGEPKLNRAIIQNVSPTIIKIICEIIYNILQGNVKLDSKTRKQLEKYKRQLRCLVCRKRSLAAKRRILNQKGGAAFLPVIIARVLPYLIGALGDKILNK